MSARGFVDHTGFGITSESCGRDAAQVVKAVESSFATTRGWTSGGLPKGGGRAAGLSPPTSGPQGRCTELVFFHELVQTLCEYMRDVVAVDQAWLLGTPTNFCASDGEARTARKR